MDKPVGYCPLTFNVNFGLDAGASGKGPLGFIPPPPGDAVAAGSTMRYWSVAQARFLDLPDNHVWNYVVGYKSNV